MRGGGNRKPTALKALQGTLRAGRTNAGEPQAEPLQRRCPSWLDDDAKRLWRYLAPRLVALGLLGDIDLPTFELVCCSYSLARRAFADIREHGVLVADKAHGGGPRKNPALQVYRDAAGQYARLAARFGLSPLDRGRLSVAPGDEPENELMSFLNMAVKEEVESGAARRITE